MDDVTVFDDGDFFHIFNRVYGFKTPEVGIGFGLCQSFGGYPSSDGKNFF